MRLAVALVVGTLGALASASTLHAQSIAGTVRDESGAVLPGVTVEVSSPALIEKVRSATSDDTGQYRIVSLSPGVYVVTFTLPGFNSVKHEGIELSGTFTATVNADMKVGALEETITVSGASPLVDVQSLTRQTVFTREVLDALPASHNIQSAAVMIPGVTVSGLVGQTGRDVGGTSKLQQPSLVFRGTELSITRWDGFHLSNLTVQGAGGGTSFYVNDAAAQEVAYSSGADSAEMSHPGLYVDLVPKDGGNRFSGYVFGDFTHDGWSASNLSRDLRDRGITNVSIVHRNYDFNPGVGGPLRRDSLWFYAAYRYEGHDATVVDSYYDKNPAPYLYEPDLSRPAHDSGTIPNQSVRLTWQATPKDKAQFWVTNQNKSRELYGVNANITPDAAGLQRTRYATPATLRWTRTQTNRLLLEGGFAVSAGYFDNGYQASVTTSYDRETIQNTPIYRITDQANNKSFGAAAGYSAVIWNQKVGRASGTYVTGAHAFKVGFEIGSGETPRPSWSTGDLRMTFNNGSPQSVTLVLPRDTKGDGYFPDLGLYVQERWTLKRATFTGGLRYDYYEGHVGAGCLPPSRWSAPQCFDGFELIAWKDLSPRVGVAYDVFGNGKTALKASFARYVVPLATENQVANNPQNTIGATDTRNWRDLNGDYTIYNPDGSVQWDELGPTSNVNFGKLIPTTATRDAKTLNGWNSRGATSEWQVVVQHELLPAMGVHGGFYRRYNHNQTAVDNTLVTNADYDGPFCIAAPRHADLPGGGDYPVCGLYDIKPTSRGQVQNHTTLARNFGGVIDQFQGIDLGANARFAGDTYLNVGVNMQKRLLDTCNTDGIDSPEVRFCRTVTPYRPDFKFSGSRSLIWDLQLSATYQLSPGPRITATWNVPGSIIAASLGRPLAAGATATKSVQLIEPETIYSDYLKQLDLRLSRRFSVGRIRLRANASLYNVFNDDFVNSVNTTFSTTASNQFMRPTAVLQGRLFKLGAQLDF
jgi:hypothetical protein